MHLEGDREVLRNLCRKKHLLAAGLPHEQYRTAVFVGAGMLRGVYAAGAGRPLERLGFADVLDYGFGTSTGAASLPFFCSRQLREHINIYWREAASDKFISLGRLFAGGPLQDTEYLCGVFRRKLDLAAVHLSPTKLYFGVTCAETGEGHFLNAKEVQPDLVEGIRASMSIPGACRGPVRIGNRFYFDGVGAMGMPVREIVEKVRPTDLLVFANAPDGEKENFRRTVLTTLCTRNLPPGVQHAFRTSGQRFDEGVQYLRTQSGFRWAILWTDSEVNHLERDECKLRAAADRAERHFEQLLLEAKARVDPEFATIAAE